MKQNAWAMVLQAKESELQEETPPVDTTPFGNFSELLEDFLTDRARAETRDDILAGKPWKDEETDRHLFRMRECTTSSAGKECETRPAPSAGIGYGSLAGTTCRIR